MNGATSDCQKCSVEVGETVRCRKYRLLGLEYWILDIFFGTVLGLLVVLVHAFLMPSGMHPLLSFLLSMLLMMTVQFVLSLLIGGLTGSIEAMVPGSFIAMGAMFVIYLPTNNLDVRLAAGASMGFLISLGFVVLDAILRVGTPHAKTHTYRVRGLQNPSVFTLSTPAWLYDILEEAGVRRRSCLQRELFAKMGKQVLFAAAGSGLNFANFPPHRSIVAIDVNPDMLNRARMRAKSYIGSIQLMETDVQKLPFPDGTFDTIATASTFCSVPDPDQGLSELYRVLKPGGNLLMFEHVRSRNPLIALEQDMMNCVMRMFGPNINRDTVGAIRNAGFIIDRIRCAYLDVFLAIEGRKVG